MWDLFLSALGCFVLRHAFRMFATEKERSQAIEPAHGTGTGRSQLPGMGAALFLLALAIREGLGMNPAPRR